MYASYVRLFGCAVVGGKKVRKMGTRFASVILSQKPMAQNPKQWSLLVLLGENIEALFIEDENV